MALSPFVLKGTFQRAKIITKNLFLSGLTAESVADALTASATQTRVGGLALTKAWNRFTTVGVSGNAATLPNLSIGQSCIVVNDGANPMKVFPYSATGVIDAAGAGNAVTLTNAKRCRFTMVAANTIISTQLGATSA